MNETLKNTAFGIMTGAALGLALGLAFGHQMGVDESDSADITVLPCSAWADTSKPDIPPHTFAGACAAEDGTLSVPVNDLPPIERCKNDDYNDGTQDRCWTEDIHGKVIIISKDDKVIS